jgi:thiamine-monophosphate kinase
LTRAAEARRLTTHDSSLYIVSALPLSEKLLIEDIRRRAGRGKRSRIPAGIGDDCAVIRLPPGHEALVTTDFSLEGVHFRREWHPPDAVGHRCLARGLSDIAAMGGEPIAAFLSLALPAKLPQSWVNRFSVGLLKLAHHFHVALVGGDTAESPNGILADIVVLGSVPRGKAILRSGARPGDRVYVTGELGSSAAALDQLFSGRKKKVSVTDFPRHFFPVPRLDAGCFLRENNLASSMIDTSDGLTTDLSHICEESGVGAMLNAAAIPRAVIGAARTPVDLKFALHGGEDYELLFTASPRAKIPPRIKGVRVSDIGVITRKQKLQLIYPDQRVETLEAQGWQHFARKSM